MSRFATGVVVAVAITAVALICSGTAQLEGCDQDPTLFLPAAFNASALSCRPVWNNFVLRYSQSHDNVLTTILSAAYTVGWVAMGFSHDGMMVGSSAMVGWIGKGGRAHIKQYYLGGQSSSKVAVNEGKLQATDISPVVILYGANIYLAFQLQMPAPVTQQYLLFAFGIKTPTNYRLTKHEDKASISFDFSSGTLSSSPSSSYPYHLKRSHGLLNIFGWGVLLPVGSIVARYCRGWDPLWYYLHVAIQFAGFFLGLAGVVAGIALFNKLHSNVTAHRGLGIFIFVLGILQLIAFFLRPEKGSKIRGYWNWYHHWVGRLSIFLATVNIFYGIHIGEAGNSWKVGYGINIAFLFLTTIVLEILLCTRWVKKIVTPAF